MDGRVSRGLGLAAVLWLSLLPFSVAPAANSGRSQDSPGALSDLCHRGEVTVHPGAPTTADPVSIVVSGWWGSSCPAVTGEPATAEYNITLSITVTDMVTIPPVACLTVVTPWIITRELGALLPGEYAVQADCSAGACWSFQEKVTFQVREPTGTHWQYLPAVLCACTGL